MSLFLKNFGVQSTEPVTVQMIPSLGDDTLAVCDSFTLATGDGPLPQGRWSGQNMFVKDNQLTRNTSDTQELQIADYLAIPYDVQNPKARVTVSVLFCWRQWRQRGNWYSFRSWRLHTSAIFLLVLDSATR